jgi:hypothetical protein
MVLEQLRPDTRYEKALESITQQLTFNDTFQRQLGTVVFPEGLKLRNLPGMIMSYYSPDEKIELFPMDDNMSSVNKVLDLHMADAIINSINGCTSYVRELVDAFCPGCGQHGHNVFQSGSDFCAKHLLVTEFFKKFTNTKPKVIEKYKDHQTKIRSAKQDKQKKAGYSKPQKQSPQKYRATVKLLRDLMDSIDESVSESKEYEDANEEEAASESDSASSVQE